MVAAGGAALVAVALYRLQLVLQLREPVPDLAPIEGRVSGVVDIPNACCSLYLPTAIFDFDIKPTKDGPQSGERGSAAKSS